MNIQVKIDEKVAKEYDHPVLVMVFNDENCEIIGPQVMMDEPEKYGDEVHLVLAIHHCLAHNPEIIQKAIAAFDDYIMEKAETVTAPMQ